MWSEAYILVYQNFSSGVAPSSDVYEEECRSQGVNFGVNHHVVVESEDPGWKIVDQMELEEKRKDRRSGCICSSEENYQRCCAPGWTIVWKAAFC